MEEKYTTTLYENLAGRVRQLRNTRLLYGEGAEVLMAVCEELERIYTKLDELEKKSHLHNEVRCS